MKEKTILKVTPTLAIEEIEKPDRLFAVGILDVFERRLSSEELHLLIECKSDNPEYLIYEKSFLNFFQHLFDVQEERTVFVFCPDLKKLSHEEKQEVMRFLSEQDRKHLEEIISMENIDLIEIQELEKLLLSVRLSARELLFSNFFFEDVMLIGNYSLSFPIYCLHQDTLSKYANEAKRLGLHVR